MRKYMGYAALAKRLTKILLAAPPAVQLAIAISSIIGPFMTLGPFVRSLFVGWQAFSEWCRTIFESIFGVIVYPILWPYVFLIILTLPILTTITVQFFRHQIQLEHWRERHRTVALALILLTIIIELYFVSLSPSDYFSRFSEDSVSSSIMLISMFAKIIWIIALCVTLGEKSKQRSKRIFVITVYFVAFFVALDGMLSLFSVSKALQAESQRIYAFSMFKEGTLTQEAVEEYFKISFQAEYMRYAAALSKLVVVFLFISCAFLPKRIIDIASIVGGLIFIFLGFSGLDAVIQIGKN
ncbi:hypothetical protein [Paraglaciecola hydrolytica]|nr:hypothetical protein [Paraglaciecola hydrolytica]